MLFAFISFTISASVGLGGSLLLVPAMILAFDTKSGIAIAAILLSLNNVGKVYAFRATIPLKAALPIVFITMFGAATGATALLVVDEIWVDLAVMAMIFSTLVFEVGQLKWARKINSHLMAYFSGCTSGFSGTSGPLKPR